MTKIEALEACVLKCIEAREAGAVGIPFFCRPVSWGGMGRAIAPRMEHPIGFMLIRRPDDTDETTPDSDGWEVIPREVWQQERRHGAS